MLRGGWRRAFKDRFEKIGVDRGRVGEGLRFFVFFSERVFFWIFFTAMIMLISVEGENLSITNGINQKIKKQLVNRT